MQELLFSITYPPIPITQVGPISLSLHGVFAAVGFYFGANHALKLSEEDGADSELFSEALTWAIFGAILGARFFTIPAQWYANPNYGFDDIFTLAGSYSIMGGMAGGIIAPRTTLAQSIADAPADKRLGIIDAHAALVDLAAKAPTYNFDNGLLVGEIASLLANAGGASEPIHG